jgi:hypothetical protein
MLFNGNVVLVWWLVIRNRPSFEKQTVDGAITNGVTVSKSSFQRSIDQKL